MRKLLILAPVVATLCGCTDALFPYQKPETPTPEAFREALATPDAKAAWPDKDWWKNFNSAELTGLIEQAQAHNNDIGAAVARVRQADAEVRINGAPLLPSLEATGNATHTHAGSHAGGTSGNRYNAGLTASYEADFWGKNYSALEAAKAQQSALVFDEEVVRLTTLTSVATIYFDLLTTNERLAIANDDLKAAQGVLDALEQRYKAGVVSALDVSQQESVVASQNAGIAPLALQQSKDLDALAILVGSLPESLTTPKGKLGDIAIPAVPEGLPSGLLERRPDVQEAEANLKAAHFDINRARAAFFPDITLTAQGGFASAALGSLFQPGGLLVSIGAGLVQPIFEGGLLTGQLELSKAQYEELAQNYHKAIIAAFSDTEDSLAAVKQTAAQEKAQEEAVRAAKESYELSQRQFKGGTVDITSVLNTQRTLFAANDALTIARLAHLQALAGLYKSLGGGWKS